MLGSRWGLSRSVSGKEYPEPLELTLETASPKERYKKIAFDHGAVDRLLVDVFLQAHREAPQEIILDLDATDDPLHGFEQPPQPHQLWHINVSKQCHYCDV